MPASPSEIEVSHDALDRAIDRITADELVAVIDRALGESYLQDLVAVLVTDGVIPSRAFAPADRGC